MTKQADKEKPQEFKIGDRSRRGMSPPAQSPTRRNTGSEPDGYSLGFARIEGILEKEDPVAVGAGLNKILQDLEAFQSGKSSNKEKLAAKKAMAAVERAVDLMDYLYQTKSALEAETQSK